ncbi:hypothetical protein ANCDUO_02898 [Ancylostoma duodenale]|uniref:G-protein coupled receptors family 1 profile domain-containing protein n=1 Tax=Ancylostoma duodenale TaxID=51022 RepID=A0A0C2DAL2_9BILA|nr:hypothetical protein ANCDUO_02898 [Ancylostoma duodenale]
MFVLSPSMRLTRKRAVYLVLATWAFRWFSHGLAMMHSMVNPIVYFLRNARFREGFCYFSRFLPCVHFQEFKLLSEQARRYVCCSQAIFFLK